MECGAGPGAVVGAGALPLERGEALPVRRIFDDSEDRPILGRREPKCMVGRFGTAAVLGGHHARLPQFGHHPAARTALANTPAPPLPAETRPATRLLPLPPPTTPLVRQTSPL